MKNAWELGLAAMMAMVIVGCGDDMMTTPDASVMDDSGMEDSSLPPDDAGTDADSAPPPATCSDGMMNQDETDVDCGGVCGSTCTPGQMCSAPEDCTTALCTMGTCDPMPTCMDTMQNGMETDVDCGGPMCMPCVDGLMCTADTDCVSAFCNEDMACAAPVCGNGAVEGAEECDDGSGGMPAESATCDIDCTTHMCGDGVLNVTAGEECDDGNVMDGDRCSSTCTVPAPAITIMGTQTFDTTAGTLDGMPVTGWDAATSTLTIGGLDIPGGATLNVVGSEPFQVLASVDITVAGDLNAAGADGRNVGCNRPGPAGGAGGPGGTAGGNGGGFGDVGGGGTRDGATATGMGGGAGGTQDNTGGGGGGHATRGGDGAAASFSSGGTPGAGGAAYGTVLTFEGGSGGGGGSVDDDGPDGFRNDGGSSGGGGGGAVLLDALGNVTVTGSIDARGGGGGAGGCSSSGGGGGSGGWIRLLAGSAVPDISAGNLNVDGGSGGIDPGAGGDGAAGRTEIGSPPLCMDGVRNQDETDIDCGGTICGGCAFRGACIGDADCAMGTCSGGFCVGASCTNGMMDGMETDMDCGGPECTGCADGLMCTGATDCSGTACEAGACVSCADGVRNAMETDVDCGGPDCGGCATGQMCTAGTDCRSGTCTAMVCEVPTFRDDFETGMTLGTAWDTSGSADWFGSTRPPISGTFSAESGNISHGQVSTLDLAVTCDAGATVTFAFDTSTESCCDFLRFFIDGASPAGTSYWGGTRSGTATFPVPAGAHTIRWQYTKDGSVSTLSDSVWIDDVVVTGCTAP